MSPIPARVLPTVSPPTGRSSRSSSAPNAPSFGKNTRFSPLKIAAAGSGGVYIISEDSKTGIIHMDGTGEFLGFFASNDVKKSLFEKLLDVVLTEEQLNKFLPTAPSSYGSIFTGSDGLVYTLNKEPGSTIQRHSINGLDLFAGRSYLPAFSAAGISSSRPTDGCWWWTTRDTSPSSTGKAISSCRFGGNSAGSERIGLFDLATGIGEDADGRLYVLDSKRNYVQIFEPTAVQLDIYKALDLYSEGRYDESRLLLESILKRNSTSYFVRLYMGQNYMQQGAYEQAIHEFQVAGAKAEYSEAFWELRNLWLQDHMLYILIALLVLAVAGVVLKSLSHRRKPAPAPVPDGSNPGRLSRVRRTCFSSSSSPFTPSIRHMK